MHKGIAIYIEWSVIARYPKIIPMSEASEYMVRLSRKDAEIKVIK